MCGRGGAGGVRGRGEGRAGGGVDGEGEREEELWSREVESDSTAASPPI